MKLEELDDLGVPYTTETVPTIYVGREPARYVVALVVGYDDDDLVDDAAAHPGVPMHELAAAAALDLTRDENCRGTNWFVYDREAGDWRNIEQGSFESNASYNYNPRRQR